jgi:hypothetical protein
MPVAPSSFAIEYARSDEFCAPIDFPRRGNVFAPAVNDAHITIVMRGVLEFDYDQYLKFYPLPYSAMQAVCLGEHGLRLD